MDQAAPAHQAFSGHQRERREKPNLPKQLDNGYLAIGKQKVEFHRVGGAN
jgi:hypothetical protein